MLYAKSQFNKALMRRFLSTQ